MAALLAVALAVSAWAQPGLKNPSFEEGGTVPSGWFFPPVSANAGYRVQIVDQCARPGSRCVEMSFQAVDSPNRQSFGNLMQTLDGTPYRGKRIRFRAMVRVQGNGNRGEEQPVRAQMWLRVDLPGGRVGFFDNMQNRPITDRAWRQYEIEGDVEPDAERVALGVMHFGRHSILADEASLEIVGDARFAPPAPPRPLTGQGLRNLVAFTRLTGYVRHFFPSQQAVTANWDQFTVDGVSAVEEAKDAAELQKILLRVLQPMAAGVQVFPARGAPPLAVRRASRMVAWRHAGYGAGNPGPYKSELVTRETPEDGALPAPYEADLGSGLRCRVPVAMPEPYRAVREPQTSQAPPVYRAWSRPVRLAAVITAWNVFQHFYPYFDVVKTDWPAALESALRSAATDKDEGEFLLTLRRLVAALNDGHGGVYGPGQNYAVVPLLLDWIEGRVVVTHVAQAQGQAIGPGDALVSVDGRPVGSVLAEIEQQVSGATPQWVRHAALKQLTTGAPGAPVTLEVESPHARGTVRSVSLRRVPPDKWIESRPEPVREMETGIWYVDLTRINDKQWQDVLVNLERAPGIVFDMRGYPSLARPEFLEHLTTQPMTSAQWHIPIILAPDRSRVEWTRNGEWQMTPRAPYLKGRKAFLIDARAISYAESCMGIVEHYKLGAIVGQATAGTNGNVNPFRVPGGYQIFWTGMKVLKHDGTRHHGVGIRPTVEVSRTRAGLAAGRDEVLEAGLKEVKGGG